VSEPVLTTTQLTKAYGDVLAVDHLDLHVGRGEIYGFLGLNGAGKSTTIRMVLGLVQPTSGFATVLGHRIAPGATAPWREVGHLVESATAFPELTVRENLEVAARLHGIRDAKPVDTVIERLAIGPYRDRRARHLSVGNLQRLALARALLHHPRLLVLDEPANGLDPAGVIEIRGLLRSLADDGVTVFMSSHHLSEVDRLATRIGVVHRGRLVEELGTAELEARRRRWLCVGARDLDRAGAALRAHGITWTLSEADGAPALVVEDARAVDAPDEVARWLVAADIAPTHLAVVREDLERHFVRVVGGAR
jgi:ABC-2 type transport system ATP-binding protein